MKTISIVTPMYNESEMVDKYFETMNAVCEDIAKTHKDYQFELVAVNDGSRDDTYSKIKVWAEKYKNIVAVCLSRNFGQEPAVFAGLEKASGDAVIVMDCDMQDPPELIEKMLAKWEEGFDVVNAKRTSRKVDSAFQRNTAKYYYKKLNKLSYKVKYPENVNNFRLVSRTALNVILSYPAKEKLFRNAVAQAGFKTAEVEFERKPRLEGNSHVNAKSMIRLSLSGIADASVKPLDYSFFTALIFLAVGGLCSLASLVLLILGYKEVVISPFLTSPLFVVISVFFLFMMFTGVILLFVSIASFYLGKSYTEIKNRPMYTIEETLNEKNKK